MVIPDEQLITAIEWRIHNPLNSYLVIHRYCTRTYVMFRSIYQGTKATKTIAAQLT